jgi:hypothetical protein
MLRQQHRYIQAIMADHSSNRVYSATYSNVSSLCPASVSEVDLYFLL